ncbi:methionine biosynthesis protein MetW [Rickettsiales bacterium]|nr:methionine biosynthesis protein MetW [Rickettsiales bacterium]
MNIRSDFQNIANLIEENSKILDIGCGDGELLQYLKKQKKADVRGLEISQESVSKAISRGISAIQGDCEKDLSNYPDNHFDYAILSQTLQAMKDPKSLMEEMLRIAKFAVISFPNFAHYQNRFQLFFGGKMPVRESIPHEWYNTPNIHFCTIKDFEDLCNLMNIAIEKRTYLNCKNNVIYSFVKRFYANFFAEYGIFLIKKDSASQKLL